MTASFQSNFPICKRPDVVIRAITKQSDFKSVLTLSQVCRNFRRKKIIHGIGESNLPNTNFTRILVSAMILQFDCMILKYDSEQKTDVIQYLDKENGVCDRMFEKKHTNLKGITALDLAMGDLERILKFQKTELNSLSVTVNWSPRDSTPVARLFPEKLKNVLKSKIIKTKNLNISAFRQSYFMAVIPFVDSEFLEKLSINRPDGFKRRDKDAFNLDMEEIVSTEQWKKLEQFDSGSYKFSPPLEQLVHFSNINVHLNSFLLKDLKFLRQAFSKSSNFKFISAIKS
ncbi:Protein CBG04838 [Caenorhabditis briggsae]|uniref:Protein CBG04838 n=1 Tax=Caenorhabditis briggsae TaxID=6238 RepID=A8WYL2_CAEBR|nr:Protein CBG04838 [Caenorhabditis briggsae]CAP25470.2 Protein CBG04838 [Caenorhabditis briggsae]